MIYRNKKTGAEIVTDSKIVCDMWEPVEVPTFHAEEETAKPKRKPRVKKEDK